MKDWKRKQSLYFYLLIEKCITLECEEVKELDTRDVTEHEVDNDSNTTAANKQWQVSSQSQPPDQTTNENKHQIQDLFLHLNWIMGKGESDYKTNSETKNISYGPYYVCHMVWAMYYDWY